jgi:hypothetical protein
MPKEINTNLFSETLIGWNLEKPLMSLNGTEWRERGYGLRKIRDAAGQ